MATTIGKTELDKALDELIEVHLDFESFAQKYQQRLDETLNRLAGLLADRGIVTDWRREETTGEADDR